MQAKKPSHKGVSGGTVGAGRAMRVLLGLALSGLAAGQALAEPWTLDTLVVTGTRSERRQLESPVRTEVVSAAELERTHARDLKEALQNVPGLQLREIHGKSGFEVWLQGLDADRVLVLVDGLPVSATTGSTTDVSQLALAEVERIEVVKGAMSAQYGSAAMGGVVHVITRDIPVGLSGELEADAGSYGEQNPTGDALDLGAGHGRARVSLGGQTWRGRLAVDRNESNGVDPEPRDWPQPGDAVTREHGQGRLEWHPADAGRFYVQAEAFDEQAATRYRLQLPGRTVDQSKHEVAERRRLTAGGRWRHDNGLRWQVDGVAETLSDDTRKQAAGTAFDDRRADQDLNRLSSQFELPAWGQHLWQLGADLHRQALRQSKDGASELDRVGDVERDARELYVQDDWFLSERLELLAGLRQQWDSDFGPHHAPKLNLRWALREDDAWQLAARLGWGAGYRVPDLKERHYRFDHSQLGYVVEGNPTLQPERSSSWQLGLGGVRRERLELDLNLFQNRLRDLIQTDRDPVATAARGDGVQVYRYLNVARARTAGAELVLGWQLQERLRLQLGYLNLRSEDDSTGGELTHRPRHQANAGFDWRPRATQLEASLRARYQSSELVDSASGARSPGWWLLDSKLNWDVDQDLRLFAGIDNLFNQQRDFSDRNDFGPVTGRLVYAGVRYRWDQ